MTLFGKMFSDGYKIHPLHVANFALVPERAGRLVRDNFRGKFGMRGTLMGVGF
jgi:hypothetical protein